MTLIPNKIKFATSATTGTIKVGNFILGINDNITYGPTSVTGFYQGLSPVFSGYTVYQNKVSGGPSTFRPNNDSEFIGLAKALGGTNVTGVTDGLVYLNSQSSIIVVNRDYEDMKTSGLTVCLNPSYVPSYPKSGSTFYNLANISSPLSFTMNNGVGFSSDGGGSLLFDGVDDEVVSDLVYTATSGMTWDVWFKRTSDGNVFNMIMSHFMPYLAFRGTGSGGDTNEFQIAYRSITGASQTQRNLYTTTKYQNNIWYNVTFTLFYDLPNLNSTAKIYVNGVLETSVSYYSDSVYQVSSGNRLRIGNYTTNQYPFPGYIGRFLVYDRELSNNEIIQNYQSYLPIILNENIVSNGLLFYVDAGYRPSYPTTGTTWYDVSGYGRNGTLTNGPTYSSANGGSIVFDGTDDFCPTGAFALSSSTSSLSFNFWVKMSGSTSQNQFFLNKDGYGFPHITIGRVNNSDSLRFNFEEGPYVFTNYFSGTNNTWVNVQLVVTYGNATVRAYKNGVFYGTQISSTSPQNFPYTNTALNIGGLGYGGYVTGNMSIVQIYNKALSNSEVLQNYNAQKSRYGL
jgi:hypothetical protein